MFDRSAFSDDEWKQVVAAPALVGLAVAAASPNGPFGVIKEMMTVGLVMGESAQQPQSNALIAALVADVKARQTRPVPPSGLDTPEKARQVAIRDLGELSTLLERKAPGEADGFRRWLLDIGRRVAEASNEGGFLGIGGERVSALEKATLRQIGFAMGLPASGEA